MAWMHGTRAQPETGTTAALECGFLVGAGRGRSSLSVGRRGAGDEGNASAQPRVPFSEVANGESLVVHRTLLPSPIPSTALLLFLPPLALPPRTYRRTTICECQLSCTLRRDS